MASSLFWRFVFLVAAPTATALFVARYHPRTLSVSRQVHSMYSGPFLQEGCRAADYICFYGLVTAALLAWGVAVYLARKASSSWQMLSAAGFALVCWLQCLVAAVLPTSWRMTSGCAYGSYVVSFLEEHMNGPKVDAVVRQYTYRLRFSCIVHRAFLLALGLVWVQYLVTCRIGTLEASSMWHRYGGRLRCLWCAQLSLAVCLLVAVGVAYVEVVNAHHALRGDLLNDPPLLACVVCIAAVAVAMLGVLLWSLALSMKALHDVARRLSRASKLVRSQPMHRGSATAPPQHSVDRKLRRARRALRSQIIGVGASLATSLSVIPSVLVSGTMMKIEQWGDSEEGLGLYMNSAWKLIEVLVVLTTAVLMCGGHRPAPKRKQDLEGALHCCRPTVVPNWDEDEEKGTGWTAKVSALAERSMSVAELLDFYKGLGRDYMHDYEPGLHTTDDVVCQAIIPLSRGRHGGPAAFAGAGHEGRPDKMVTHNWRNLFRDLVAAVLSDALEETSFGLVAKLLETDVALLEGMLGERRSRKYWICAFCVNQHASICDRKGCLCNVPKHFDGTDCEMNKFDDMMCLLAVRSPAFSQLVAVDAAFDLFSRCWCIAEIAEGQRLGLVQQIQISSRHNFEASEEKLQNLDIQEMRAFYDKDRALILEKVKQQYGQEGGLDRFNAVMKSLLFNTGSGLLTAWRNLDASQQLGEAGRLMKWVAADNGGGRVWQLWDAQ